MSAGTLTQAIRNFAKSLEGWLTNAMTNFPHEIIRTKVTRESPFQQLFSNSLILKNVQCADQLLTYQILTVIYNRVMWLICDPRVS